VNDQTLVVTVDLFDCMRLIGLGHVNTSSLIGKSMTGKQEMLLRDFESIILLHPEPENIVNRLSKNSFVKAPEIIRPLTSYSDEEILTLLS
jgi:hypothetical protein